MYITIITSISKSRSNHTDIIIFTHYNNNNNNNDNDDDSYYTDLCIHILYNTFEKANFLHWFTKLRLFICFE